MIPGYKYFALNISEEFHQNTEHRVSCLIRGFREKMAIKVGHAHGGDADGGVHGGVVVVMVVMVMPLKTIKVVRAGSFKYWAQGYTLRSQLAVT